MALPRPALAALVATSLLLGGCWADDDDDPVATGADDPAEQADEPTEPDGTTEPEDPDEPATTDGGEAPPRFDDAGPVEPPPGAPTAAELEEIIPPADELGPRFTLIEQDTFELDDEPSAPLCEDGWPGNHLSELAGTGDLGGIAVFYAYDPEDEGPLVALSAASLPDAAGHVADARAQIEACVAAGPKGDLAVDGQVVSYEVLPDPDLGDAALAYRVVNRTGLPGGVPAEDLNIELTTTATVVAVGDIVVLVVGSDSDPIPDSPPADRLDAAMVEDFVALVVERVAALR